MAMTSGFEVGSTVVTLARPTQYHPRLCSHRVYQFCSECCLEVGKGGKGGGGLGVGVFKKGLGVNAPSLSAHVDGALMTHVWGAPSHPPFAISANLDQPRCPGGPCHKEVRAMGWPVHIPTIGTPAAPHWAWVGGVRRPQSHCNLCPNCEAQTETPAVRCCLTLAALMGLSPMTLALSLNPLSPPQCPPPVQFRTARGPRPSARGILTAAPPEIYNQGHPPGACVWQLWQCTQTRSCEHTPDHLPSARPCGADRPTCSGAAAPRRLPRGGAGGRHTHVRHTPQGASWGGGDRGAAQHNAGRVRRGDLRHRAICRTPSASTPSPKWPALPTAQRCEGQRRLPHAHAPAPRSLPSHTQWAHGLSVAHSAPPKTNPLQPDFLGERGAGGAPRTWAVTGLLVLQYNGMGFRRSVCPTQKSAQIRQPCSKRAADSDAVDLSPCIAHKVV